MKRHLALGSALLAALAATLGFAAPVSVARASHAVFTFTAPGVAFQSPGTVSVAGRFTNTSRRRMRHVRIVAARLGPAGPITNLPVFLGRLGAGKTLLVQVDFRGAGLVHNAAYRLVLRGRYVTRGHRRHAFTVRTSIIIPRLAPGHAELQTAVAHAARVKGAPFPPQPPTFDSEVNISRWTVPTGPFSAGKRTPATMTVKAPRGDPGQIVFRANNSMNISGSSLIAEPSGAMNAGRIVFASGNWWDAYSTNGGGTFTQVNPTTIFPNDSIGFCCDQVVQYVPSIDRFVWLLQGAGGVGYRLAEATPATVAATGATAWTYWRLPATLFGQPAGTGVDYPDLSVGTNDLYLSWDVGVPCPKGCHSGLQVTRVPLSQIQAGGTINLGYTHPEDSAMAWGSHLTQDTGDEIFWAGHNSNSQLRVFSLAVNSSFYSWRDVGISSWANGTPTSTTPDGVNWLTESNGFPGSAIIGSTRVGQSQVWFAWTAAADRRFPQPHVEMVALNRNTGFSKIQQVQIWNQAYAFAYPALATNQCTGEVGLSLEYGGGSRYENHVVGFWGDFVLYATTSSNVGTPRFGDYVTIRQAPRTTRDFGNLFTAFGYGVNKLPPPQTGQRADVHYVLFGRPPETCLIG